MVAIHPRTLIRHAIVDVLKKSESVTPICGQRIFANRQSPWDADELPAMGVYQLDEEPLETDKHPDPDERRLNIAFEIIAKGDEGLEDLVDSVSLALDSELTLDALSERLQENDTLLQLDYSGFELGLAVDGNRLVGVGIVTFAIDYSMPPNVPAYDELPAFIIAQSGWDLAGSDPRVIDAEDTTFMPGWERPAKEETP